MKIDNKTKKRFFKYVIKHKKGCWEWTGYKSNNGYGKLQINDAPEGAHRISFRIHKGEINPGNFVCHSCDNPGCVNPKHLWQGTSAENSKDMVNKGRSYTGPKTEAAKLKIKLWHTGRTLSKETRAKISASKKGNNNCIGRIMSPETRAKIGAANRKIRQLKKESFQLITLHL